MRADLHVHSTASDGTCRPEELVALALEAGLTHLAITDHDSVEAIQRAQVAAAATGLHLIAGVELSAVTADGRDVHMLGYWVDPADPALRRHLLDLRAARMRRAEKMVASLSHAGFPIDIETVLPYSDGGALGRSHIARALVDSGHATSVRDAFERLIGRGRPFYAAKETMTPDEAIETILRCGGVAVVAHPGVNGLDDEVRRLADVGLAGIEAYHADHSAEQRDRFSALADETGLLVTGGSDFHGPEAPNAPLGSVEIPVDRLSAFLGSRSGV